MMTMKDKLLIKYKIVAICEQLVEWLMREVVDHSGEFHFNGLSIKLGAISSKWWIRLWPFVNTIVEWLMGEVVDHNGEFHFNGLSIKLCDD